MAGFRVVSLALIIGLSRPSWVGGIAAQQSLSPRLEGVSKGASLDRFLCDGTGETAFSFRLTRLGRGILGPDIGVSLFPGALAAPALIWATDFGAAYNVSLPNMSFLLKGGPSALTGIGEGVLFVPGVHVGAGVVIRVDAHTGIRVDGVRHFYSENGETEPIWSIGLGFCSLPPAGSKSSEATR